MVTLKALRQICGDYQGPGVDTFGPYSGLVREGGTFQAKDSDAEQLEAAGLAERVRSYVRPPLVAPSRSVEDFKATFPPENKALRPQPHKAR